MPTARYSLGSGVVKGVLYAIGGESAILDLLTPLKPTSSRVDYQGADADTQRRSRSRCC